MEISRVINIIAMPIEEQLKWAKISSLLSLTLHKIQEILYFYDMIRYSDQERDMLINIDKDIRFGIIKSPGKEQEKIISDTRQKYHTWSRGARDIFCHEIHALQNFIHSLTSVKNLTDSDKLELEKLEAAHEEFKETFPDFDTVRNSIAHTEETLSGFESDGNKLKSKKSDANKRTLNGEMRLGDDPFASGSEIIATNAMSKDFYSFSSRDNGQFQVEISDRTIAKIIEIRSKIISVFEPALPAIARFE